MGAVVAFCLDNGRETLLCDGKEGVASRSGLDGVDGNVDRSVLIVSKVGSVTHSAVLEADGHGEGRGKFTVDLRLGGTSTDGTPRREVGKVLGRDDIYVLARAILGLSLALTKELSSGRETHLSKLDQELASHLQTAVDLVGAVHVGVVDETLPADGGTWLLEVDAHDDQQVLLGGLGVLAELLSVSERLLGVVNGAWAWCELGPDRNVGGCVTTCASVTPRQLTRQQQGDGRRHHGR